ncbi:MAG: nuclear transport factor 2 family protein [Bacteroidota bacterium]|nr:nuclear transport factor 2 family protein [Bacteroidota bacterium]
MENIFDETNDKIQRALNEAKKKEIKEKFDASFVKTDNTLPPDIESQWLNYIEEFELQFENAKRISVRTFVGNPSFPPLSEIPEHRLHQELLNVLRYLSVHNVNVDFICEVPDTEAYRFVTEELLDLETDDIHIEGMSTNFIYEEFHPNPELDAKQIAEQFLAQFFDRELDYALNNFAEDEMHDSAGKRTGKEEMRKRIEQFYLKFAVFPYSKHEVLDCTIADNYAVVRLNSEWNGIQAETFEQQSFSGISTIKMKKRPYGGCDVIQTNIVGVEL